MALCDACTAARLLTDSNSLFPLALFSIAAESEHCGGGDGVKEVKLGPLCTLFLKNPDIKFLVTVLSRNNQHEITVIAQKFRNLHLYGCWWYCNNPSIIRSVTQMRLEMLHSGFTAQHSDARVLDQLIYKWKHSKNAIADVLVEQFKKLSMTGWKISEADVKREVQRLLGGSYEEFLSK